MEEASVFDRFLSLAQRELSADDVRLLAHGEEPPRAENVVLARLPDGRHVVASFSAAPRDREVLERRLAMLAGTFAEALASPPSEKTRARQSVVTSLHEELKALAQRARAHDVVVIDGDSPVVWGCASVAARPRARTDLLLRDVSDRELAAQDEPSSPAPLHAVPDESGPLEDPTAPTGRLRVAPPPPVSAPMLSHGDDMEEEEEPEISQRAIAAIRALPSLDLLHKGKHLRHASREGSFHLVLSFSGIYLLCMVFDGEFDELRAERAAQDALPRIERLVLALPPLHPDPEPVGGAIAMRRPRRR
ncbi:MAG: hypothetical protein KF819_05180 [Labilithrix sp.]|nr:hypothetical protein [Labilithrix sp.]